MTTIKTIIIEPFKSGFPDRRPWRLVDVDDTLKTWQDVVGGLIEWITIDPDYTNDGFYLNDEGKLMQLPVNGVATFLARSVLMPGDWISGTVALLGPADEEGRNTEADTDHWLTILDHVWAIHGLHGARPGEPRLHTMNGPPPEKGDDE